jgi:hypothetical protein
MLDEELSDASRVIVKPVNRGTGVAVIVALLRVTNSTSAAFA